MKILNFAFDFDDVLVAFNATFALYHNERHGTVIGYDDIHNHDLEHVYDCTKEEIIARIGAFFLSENHVATPAALGAQQMLHNVNKHGRSFVVTARPERFQEQTQVLVDLLFPGQIDFVHYTSQFGSEAGETPKTKAEVCLGLEATLLVDDMPHHTDGAALEGLKTVLLHTPWNCSHEIHPTTTRVRGLKEVESEIIKIASLVSK